jgi:hypothetical protein
MRPSTGSARIGPNLRVDEESVIASVPRDVDKAGCSAVAEASYHPSEAGRTDSVPPADLRAAAIGLGESDEFLIRDIAAPAVFEVRGHPTD